MTPQDFNALLKALDRIGEAIEDKSGSREVKVVNRFSVVFKMLKTLHKTLVDVNEKTTAKIVLSIMKTYTKIATEVLNEDSKSSK